MSANEISVYVRQAIESGQLSEADGARIQSELWALFAKKADRYALGDSSVRIETAEALVQSIRFTIDQALAGLSTSGRAAALRERSIEVLYREGLEVIWQRMTRARLRYQWMVAAPSPVTNAAYRDTLRGIGTFFESYSYTLLAHEIPGRIDYPLAWPVAESEQGIVYIDTYLRRLQVEHTFCTRFSRESVQALLAATYIDPEEQVVNLFEPVAIHALGHALLDTKGERLLFQREEQDRLQRQLAGQTLAEVTRRLHGAVTTVMVARSMEGDATRTYLRYMADILARRFVELAPVQGLTGVFVAAPEAETSDTRYIDGPCLSNAALRRGIDALEACSSPTEKGVCLRRYGRSMRDVIELLGACVWPDEVTTVLDAWPETVRRMLRHYVHEQKSNDATWHSRTRWEDGLK